MLNFMQELRNKTQPYQPITLGKERNIVEIIKEKPVEADEILRDYVRDRIAPIISTIAKCAGRSGIDGVTSTEGTFPSVMEGKGKEIVITTPNFVCAYYQDHTGRGHNNDYFFIKKGNTTYVVRPYMSQPLTYATDLLLGSNGNHQQLMSDVLDQVLIPMCKDIDHEMFGI